MKPAHKPVSCLEIIPYALLCILSFESISPQSSQQHSTWAKGKLVLAILSPNHSSLCQTCAKPVGANHWSLCQTKLRTGLIPKCYVLCTPSTRPLTPPPISIFQLTCNCSAQPRSTCLRAALRPRLKLLYPCLPLFPCPSPPALCAAPDRLASQQLALLTAPGTAKWPA